MRSQPGVRNRLPSAWDTDDYSSSLLPSIAASFFAIRAAFLRSFAFRSRSFASRTSALPSSVVIDTLVLVHPLGPFALGFPHVRPPLNEPVDERAP